ncbi:hypothetical protein [Brevibacillus brevis]|uniref:hypothetical protein n=1 Tax=Brevibacillus brevis TaxID=1393 RepID=UPI0007D8C6BB|nr:hypothetical protein [Brevibacillus brevis]
MTKPLSKKCKCGQPYDAFTVSKYMDKDEFEHPCPSCGEILQVRLRAMDVEWVFDKNFKRE